MTEPPHHNPSSPMALSDLPQPSPSKRKRNLPGMPDPDAEVVALSPKTLLATNRFVCEICNKGFQRDQNLQLHRRGHNLPWKLRQRDTTEVRKKVYVCPETTCVHHNPARALGDLTGIKKHFCRKHGEKKLKCERCSKKYAVKSDWKAHMKTCGTREYRCACGTLFSRRDSFVTHRAFCDALAEESARTQTQTLGTGKDDVEAPSSSSSPPPPPLTPSTSVVSPTLSIQSSEIIAENAAARQSPPPSNPTTLLVNAATTVTPSMSGNFFASMLASAAAPNSTFPNLTAAIAAIEPTSLTLSSPLYLSSNDPPLQDPHHHHNHHHYTAALSATALLLKAAEMGAAASNASSLLRGFGMSSSSSSSSPTGQDDPTTQWSRHVKQEQNLMSTTPADHNLGLGLPCGNNHHNAAGFADVMMGSPPGPGPFGGSNHQPMMTRDLLGLGIGGGGAGGASRGGLSSLLTSFGGGSFDSSGGGGGV